MRKLIGGVLAAGLLVAAVVVAEAPAGAAKSLLTCTKLAGTATWSPPVSPTVKATHNVSAKATLSGCTGTKGITSGVTSFSSKGKLKENCAVLLASKAPSTATASIKWSNGKTSILKMLKLTYGGSVGAQKITGKVTGGSQTSFIGKTTVLVSQFVPNGGGCLNKGVALKTAAVSLKVKTKSTLG